MTDAVPAITLCLQDPVCLSAATAGLASLIATGRRIQTMESVPRSQRSLCRGCLSVFVGCSYTATASFALCFLGGQLWPERMKELASLIVMLSIALDWSSERAAQLLRAILITIARTYLKELEQQNPDPRRHQRTSSNDERPSAPQ